MEVSRLTGKLSHRLSGIFAQLLVLRYPPCEAGGGGGCVGIPRPQLTTLKSAGEGGGEDPESLMERGTGWSHRDLPQLRWAGVWRAFLLGWNKRGAEAFGPFWGDSGEVFWSRRIWSKALQRRTLGA